MINRRNFVKALPVLAVLEPQAALLAAARTEAHEDVLDFVKPRIGTGGHGHTYPGATVPFGMVQLSPDTYTAGWDWCSGYHESDSSIMGFSHTHLSGTGCADLLDFLVMPGTGEAKTEPGSREHPETGYRSRFSHADEIATPGYYSVLLSDYKIRAELTATERVGVHRYTFPASPESHFIVDLAHGAEDPPKPALWAQVKMIDDHTITGGRSMNGWAPGREIYFAMQFSKPFASFELLADGAKTQSGTQEAKGKSIKALVHYTTAEGETLLVKTALSSVSAEGALRNLAAEVPDFDFEKVRGKAQSAWRRELSKAVIETPDRQKKEIFYTSLYHTLLSPTLFDDVDGQYRGMDKAVHRVPAGLHNYSTFSLWDTYRTTHPLYTLLQSERVPDFANCLIRMAAASPAGMPVWPLHSRETGCMTGYHSAVVIAEAAMKGFPAIDLQTLYPILKKWVLESGYRGLDHYARFGYIPCELEEESASKTLDYAYDDWAVAHIARAVGAMDDYKMFSERSKNYRNLFQSDLKFIVPRDQNGKWAGPFEPRQISISKKWRDFTESNSWQATFANQHDLKGYIQLFGGRQAFIDKLDALFNQSSELPPDSPPDIAGLVGQYAHGNEPSHHIAYLYCYAGAPYKTQERVRSLLDTMYRDEPDGMAGNEDCGQMSAWYVMSALGFYPVDPVSGNYVCGSPLFERAVLTLGRGKKLTIEARRKTPADKYIRAITLNGRPLDRIWFRHSEIANGGTLVFEMSPEPDKTFASGEPAAPPSLTA